jgi:hypothetical protein
LRLYALTIHHDEVDKTSTNHMDDDDKDLDIRGHQESYWSAFESREAESYSTNSILSHMPAD